jgi:nucleoside-diphosphate-sugar epimerase
MLQQYCIQYGINGCCLRAPWIMEKDDFKYTLSFGDDVFGAPVWKDEVSPEAAEAYRESGTVPLLLDAEGNPLKRNFVHVDDLVSAILAAIDNPATRGQLFNICMDEPVDYGEMASYLKESRGLPSVEIESRFHSNWMDNAKARLQLGWQPRFDLKQLIDSAWTYLRSANEPRKIWYPG